MAYADSIRTTAPTMEAVASLIEGIPSSGYPLTFLTYSPTISAVAPFTFTSTTVNFAKYFRIGKIVFFAMSFSGTAGGTLAGVITVTVPLTMVNQGVTFATQVTDGGAVLTGSTSINSTTTIDIRKYNASAYTAGAVGVTLYGFYEVP